MEQMTIFDFIEEKDHYFSPSIFTLASGIIQIILPEKNGKVATWFGFTGKDAEIIYSPKVYMDLSKDSK